MRAPGTRRWQIFVADPDGACAQARNLNGTEVREGSPAHTACAPPVAGCPYAKSCACAWYEVDAPLDRLSTATFVAGARSCPAARKQAGRQVPYGSPEHRRWSVPLPECHGPCDCDCDIRFATEDAPADRHQP